MYLVHASNIATQLIQTIRKHYIYHKAYTMNYSNINIQTKQIAIQNDAYMHICSRTMASK
jgi:hypothetical protein